MKRDTLKRFLQGLVLSSLAGCCHDYPGDYYRGQLEADALPALDGGVQEGSRLPVDTCVQAGCSSDPCFVSSLDGGEVDVLCERRPASHSCGPVLAAGGRPPPGLRPARYHCADEVGAYFAAIAHVEAAAVHGFQQLAAELRQFAAPRDLIRAAESAARDEARHARIARRLAGATAIPPVEIDATPPRTPFQVALDNAVEGRVFETFAVLTTLWQSHRARDRRVRAAFAVIAEDEVRHAELAEAVSRWLEPRLTAEERARIAAARRAAVARLIDQLHAPLPAELGFPPPEVTRRWAVQLTTFTA